MLVDLLKQKNVGICLILCIFLATFSSLSLNDIVTGQTQVNSTLQSFGTITQPLNPTAPIPSASPTVTPAPVLTPSPTGTPEPTITPTPITSPTPSPLPTPTNYPTSTPYPTITPTPTPIIYNSITYAPSDGKVFIGLEQDDMSVSGITQFGNEVGKTPYLFGFFQWFNNYGDSDPTYMLNLAKSTITAGVCGGVAMSWQPLDTNNGAGNGEEYDELTIQQIVDGQRDSYIRSVAREFRDFPYPKLITFGCEMNGEWEGYGYDSTVFKNAFRHVVNIFREENAQVAFVFQPNHAPDNNAAWAYDGRDLIQNYYPGDNYVDWLSVSCHANCGWVSYGSVQQTFSQTNYLTLCTSSPKPFFFSEMGAAPDWTNPSEPSLSQRVTWLNGFFDFCESENQVKGFMYYNYDDTRLLDEAQLANAFKISVASDAFIGG